MIAVKGNLLDSPFQIIAHQVNCQGVMGAGVAAQIKKKWPEVFEAYQTYCSKNKVADLLGSSCWADVGEHYPFKTVVNLFAQDGYGRDKRYTDYEALHDALVEFITVYRFNESIPEKTQLTISIPYMMGCGLAGGDWAVVQAILCEIEKQFNVVFVAFDLAR